LDDSVVRTKFAPVTEIFTIIVPEKSSQSSCCHRYFPLETKLSGVNVYVITTGKVLIFHRFKKSIGIARLKLLPQFFFIQILKYSTLFEGHGRFPLLVSEVAGPNCTGNGFFSRHLYLKNPLGECKKPAILSAGLEKPVGIRCKIRYLCGLVLQSVPQICIGFYLDLDPDPGSTFFSIWIRIQEVKVIGKK